MWISRTVVAFGFVIIAAGCASEPGREWMKVSERYTVEDFRRDHAACTNKGKLDETDPRVRDCLRGRGWVDVARPAEKSQDLSERQRPSVAPGRRGY